MTQEEVEAVARAFYENQEYARGWHVEPEILKEQFRGYARLAIAALDDHAGNLPPAMTSLVLSQSIEASRDYLMEAKGISTLPGSTFRAVLRGPRHTFDVCNNDYFKLIGHRDLFSIPIREALPELIGQGYYELLDQLYTTKQSFVGTKLLLKLQTTPDSPLEEHIIDVVYRPIESEAGEVLGVFAEGHDRTSQARA